MTDEKAQMDSLVPFEAKTLQKIAPDVEEGANSMVVDSRESAKKATEFRNLMDDYLKEVDKTLDPVREQAHKTWKASIAAKEMVAGPFKKAKATVDLKIGKYIREEEARRRADEERIRREEEQRLEEERLQAALTAESRGETEDVERILEEPAPTVPTPVLPSVKQELNDVSIATLWDYEVDNFRAFANHCVANDLFSLLDISKGNVRKYASAIGDSKKIPGLRIFSKDSVRRRRG